MLTHVKVVRTAPPAEHLSALKRDTRHFPFGKRLVDLVITVPLLVLLAPLMLAVAVAIRLTSPGPALFRQSRIGLGERPFTMLKFRTMANGANDRVHQAFNRRELLGELDGSAPDGVYKPANDSRITPLGSVLRRYSIDELPQLINVLKGEMSLVGPRPALPWEVALFTAEERLRHRLPPGITGLWQVSGRNLLNMKQMLALDLHYCEEASLHLDLVILLRTPKAALLDRSTR